MHEWLRTVIDGPLADGPPKDGSTTDKLTHDPADRPADDNNDPPAIDNSPADDRHIDKNPFPAATSSLSLPMNLECQKLRDTASEAYGLCPASRLLREVFSLWPILDEAIHFIREGIVAPVPVRTHQQACRSIWLTAGVPRNHQVSSRARLMPWGHDQDPFYSRTLRLVSSEGASDGHSRHHTS
ncbi:hypothetical protein VDGL01_08343 [Verticillium dahliae]